LVRTLLRAARPEEALAAIDELSGQSVRAEMLRAQALALLGRHAEARSAVDASFRRENSLQRLHTRAHLALFVAPIPDGERELRDLLSQAPEDALLLSRLGFYLAVWGGDDRREEAMSMLRDAAANQPDDAGIQSNLGWGGYQSGLYDQAVEALEAALAIDENRHQDRARLARALDAAGEPRRALELLRSAVTARPAAPWSDEARALLEQLEAKATRSSSAGADS
jgi:tetratricopeptide (TPR) repeat protein